MMDTGKYICVAVKSPWFMRGEYRKTFTMDGDFVSHVQVGDVIGCHLMLRKFAPYDNCIGILTDEAKLQCHEEAKRTIEADTSVCYADALRSTYVDWVSKRIWKVTKRKWYLDLATDKEFLEITIEVAEDK